MYARVNRVWLAMVWLVIGCGLVWSDDQLNTLVAQGKPAKVVEYIDQSIPAANRSIDVWLIYAIALDSTNGDKVKIQAALSEAQKLQPSDPRVSAAFGNYFFKQKNYTDALPHYQKWYLLERNATAAENMAICASRLKMWEKALDAAESAIHLDSNSIEARKILSTIYINNKDYAEAAKELEFIATRIKDDLTLWKKLSRCYEETNNRDGLIMVSQRIADLDKKDLPSRRRLVENALDKKDTGAAFNLLRELAILTPDDAKVFKHLYQISIEKNQKKDGVLYLRNFLALDSSDASAYKVLGDLYFEQKNNDEALVAYRKAFKQNPAITGLFKQYMSILFEQKKDDEVLTVTPKAMSAGEMDGTSWAAVSEIHKKNGHFAEALPFAQEALKADPKNVTLLASLAECQAVAGKPSDALINYQQVVLLNPNANKEYKAIGDLLSKMNRTDEAMSNYRRYLEKSPNDEQIACIAGLYVHGKKQYKEAIEYLEKVKEPKLQNLGFFMALGNCYYNIGNYSKTAENYKKALAKGPSETHQKELLKPLAESYEKTGSRLEAAKTYEAYVKLPGVHDAEASFKQAALREESDKTAAMALYQANTIAFPQDARNFVRLGVLSSEDKTQMSRAAGILQKASQLAPSDTLVWQKLSEVYHASEQTDNELAASIKLAELMPDNIEAHKQAGTILFKQKKYPQAIPHLEKTALKVTKDAGIVRMLAESFVQIKNSAKAVEWFAKLKELEPDDPAVWLSYIAAADAADKKDVAAEAKRSLADLDKKVASKDPKAIEPRVRLSDYLFAKGDFDGAYPLYKDLAVLTPKEKLVFSRLVEIAQKKGNAKDALAYLKQYVTLDPGNARTHLSLASQLYDQKDMDGALAEYRAAWKLDAQLKGFFAHYAEIVLAKGIDDEAETVLNAAIKNNEADGKMAMTLGKIYLKQKKYPQAIALFKKISNDDPRNIEALSLLGECQANSGDVTNAIIIYEQLVMLNPQASAEYKVLGDLRNKNGKTDQAVKAYQNYLDKTSGDEKTARFVGLYLYGKKQYADAVRYLEMIKNPSPTDEEYLLALGDSWYQQGNCQKCILFFGQARTKKTGEAELKKILRPLGECYEKTNEPLKAAEAYEAFTALPGVADADASYLKAYLREKTDQKNAITLYQANTKTFSKDARNFVRLGMLLAANPATISAAVDPLSQAALLVPKDTAIAYRLAQVYGALKNDDKELDALRKYLALDPQNLAASLRAGTILMQKKQYPRAIENLEIVLTQSPQNVDVMLQLSEAYLKTNRQERGIELLAKAQTLRKDNPELMFQLYVLYKAAGKASDAENIIKQLIQYKNETRYRSLYAEDLVDQMRLDEAMTLAQEIKKSDAMSVDGLMLVGRIQLLQNKTDEAIESFKNVSYINETYAPARYYRAEVYRKLGQLDRAIEFYTKALESNKKYGLAELGLARVAKAQKNSAAYQDHLKKARALDPENKEILNEGKEPVTPVPATTPVPAKK